MKININETIKVQLTNFGVELWNKYWDKNFEFSRKFHGFDGDENVRKLKQCQLEGHYYKFQIWELMEIFGSNMGLIENQIFVNNELILEKENSQLNKTFTEISTELNKARKKFPNAADLTVALMEECGELAQATLKCDQENIIKEAIQVAAVAIRIIEEGDSTFKNRKEISLDEKYEYEKIAKGHGFEIIEISSNSECDEYYITLIHRKWKIRLVILKKPSYSEFKDFISYLIEQIWIPGTSGSFEKFAYYIEQRMKNY